MKKITLKDIAAHFGVSVSTVSKAINDSYEISISLKTKIQQYAEDNNYSPNRLALSLLNKSTKTIGVVLPNILNYFFTQVFYGIEKVANESGYNLISCISNESYEKEVKTLGVLSSGTVDGLIISLAEETQSKNDVTHIEKFIKSQIPLVLFDRVTDLIKCDKVIVDDFEAGYKATNYFINTGCKNIAIVTPIDHSSVGKLRIDGYKKSLTENNIDYDDKLIVRLAKDDDLSLLLTFLLDYKKIDGILVLDEITAVKLMKILKPKGYRIPEDISIIGFTNGKLSEYVTPSLTTMSQHGSYIGESTARILIDKIENNLSQEEETYTTKVVKTSLIVRESTKNQSTKY